MVRACHARCLEEVWNKASRPVGDPWQLVSDEWVADQEPRVTYCTLAYAGSWSLEPGVSCERAADLGDHGPTAGKARVPTYCDLTFVYRKSYEPSWLGVLLGADVSLQVIHSPCGELAFPLPSYCDLCMLTWPV